MENIGEGEAGVPIHAPVRTEDFSTSKDRTRYAPLPSAVGLYTKADPVRLVLDGPQSISGAACAATGKSRIVEAASNLGPEAAGVLTGGLGARSAAISVVDSVGEAQVASASSRSVDRVNRGGLIFAARTISFLGDVAEGGAVAARGVIPTNLLKVIHGSAPSAASSGSLLPSTLRKNPESLPGRLPAVIEAEEEGEAAEPVVAAALFARQNARSITAAEEVLGPRVEFEEKDVEMPARIKAAGPLARGLVLLSPGIQDVPLPLLRTTALRKISEISSRHYQNNLQVRAYLGGGNYGAVYHVEYPYKERTSSGLVDRIHHFALKIFFEEGKQTKEAIFKEMNILSKLNSPHVVKHIGCCLDCSYFLMNLPSKINLSEASSQKHITPAKLKHVAAQLIYVLEYLRIKKIAHCDFKPRNIAVDTSLDDCPITVLDFGIAEDEGDRLFGRPRGPICLRPPEMYSYLSGDNGGYDLFKAHWFALGVTLYRIAYLQYPFQDRNFVEEDRAWLRTNREFLVGRCGLDEEEIKQYIMGYRHYVKPPSKYRELDPLLPDLIAKLMHRDLEHRADFKVAKSHPWFAGYDWSRLEAMYADSIPIEVAEALAAATGGS